MREVIYIIVLINIVMGFIMLYRKPRPFKGRSYRNWNKMKDSSEVKTFDNTEK